MWSPQDLLRRAKAGRDRDPISRDDAERLLGGSAAVNAEYAGLTALLAAAAGPAQPRELLGEQQAIAAFDRVYQPRSQPRQARRRSGLRLGTTVAASIMALLVAGTAFAAGTGRLPDALQRTLQDLLSGVGLPAPAVSPPAEPTASESTQAAGKPTPSAVSADPGSIGPIDVARQLSLCRSWMAFRADPRAKPVSADERHALAAVAGGENAINGFCQRLLNPTPTPTATTVKPGNPDPGGGKPSHPGKPPRN